VLRMAGSVWLFALFCCSTRGRIGQPRVGDGEVALIGIARGHRKGDAVHAGAHQRADFQELEAIMLLAQL